jgi:hypothetical protein
MAGRGNTSYAAGYHARRRQEGPRLQAAYRQGKRDTWLSIAGLGLSVLTSYAVATYQAKKAASSAETGPAAPPTAR